MTAGAKRQPTPPISEPVPIPEVFCSHLVGVHRRSGFVRLVLTVDREVYFVPPEGEDGELMERAVVARLVLPEAALPAIVAQLSNAEAALRSPSNVAVLRGVN